MKNLRILTSLSATFAILATSTALTQTTNQITGTPSNAVVLAHCQYAADNKVCGETTAANPPDAPATIAQVGPPGPPFYPRRPMPRPRAGYSRPWPRTYEDHHSAIGALIGLGAGVGLACGTSSDPNKRVVGSLIFGGFGALIGAMVAHPLPAFRSQRRYAWPNEEADPEEDAAFQPRPKIPQKTTQKTAYTGTSDALGASHE